MRASADVRLEAARPPLPAPGGPPGDGPSDLQRSGIAAVSFAFLVFGTASIVQGALQLVRARRSQALLRIMVVIAVLFAVADVIATLFL